MLSKSKLKQLQSLKLKKFRQKYNLFQAEGFRLIKTIAGQKRYRIVEIFLPEGKDFSLPPGLNSVSVTFLSEKELNALSLLSGNTDAIAICQQKKPASVSLEKFRSMIYLDDVQDPGNVGTIIRIADWFGLQAVIRSEGSADFYNPKTVQGSMGSFDNVELISLSKSEFLGKSRDVHLIGADLDGAAVQLFEPKYPFCLVLGNEGQGIDPEIKSRLHSCISIPGHPGRMAESLNVAAAAAILCSHLYR